MEPQPAKPTGVSVKQQWMCTEKDMGEVRGGSEVDKGREGEDCPFRANTSVISQKAHICLP